MQRNNLPQHLAAGDHIKESKIKGRDQTWTDLGRFLWSDLGSFVLFQFVFYLVFIMVMNTGGQVTSSHLVYTRSSPLHLPHLGSREDQKGRDAKPIEALGASKMRCRYSALVCCVASGALTSKAHAELRLKQSNLALPEMTEDSQERAWRPALPCSGRGTLRLLLQCTSLFPSASTVSCVTWTLCVFRRLPKNSYPNEMTQHVSSIQTPHVSFLQGVLISVNRDPALQHWKFIKLEIGDHLWILLYIHLLNHPTKPMCQCTDVGSCYYNPLLPLMPGLLQWLSQSQCPSCLFLRQWSINI